MGRVWAAMTTLTSPLHQRAPVPRAWRRRRPLRRASPHGFGVDVWREVRVAERHGERGVPRELHDGDQMNALHDKVAAIGVAADVPLVRRETCAFERPPHRVLLEDDRIVTDHGLSLAVYRTIERDPAATYDDVLRAVLNEWRIPATSRPKCEIVYHLGLVEQGRRKKQAARGYYKQSLALRPHADVQAALDALGK